MAKKKTTTNILGKLGSAGKKAFAGHKSDETTFGAGGDLPPGINAGIAKLVDCKLDTYKKGDNIGQPYFYAAGIVVDPYDVVIDTVRGTKQKVEGLRTSIMEPLHDTPQRKSRPDLDAHIAWMSNELRKLGLPTDEIDFEELEESMATLVEEGVHFRFRTWQGDATVEYPNPRVNHQWGGATEYDPGDEEDTLEDNSEEPEEEVEEVAPTKKKTKKKKPKTKKVDLAALGEAADDEDKDAQQELIQLAEAAEIDHEEYEHWSGVAEALENPKAKEEPEGDTIDDVEEDEVYFFKPPKKRKPVECVVTEVDEDDKTCNLKNLDDNTVYEAVAWNKLSLT